MKKLISILAIALSSTINAGEVKWDIMELSNQKFDVDGLADFKGLGFSGTTLLTDNILLTFSKRKLKGDLVMQGYNVNMKLDQLSFGLGAKAEISRHTDFFFMLQHVKVALKTSIQQYSAKVKANGTSAQMGVRSMVADNFELTAYLNHVDIASSSTSVVYGGHYHFSDEFSLGVDYEKESDEKTLSIVARLYL